MYRPRVCDNDDDDDADDDDADDDDGGCIDPGFAMMMMMMMMMMMEGVHTQDLRLTPGWLVGRAQQVRDGMSVP